MFISIYIQLYYSNIDKHVRSCGVKSLALYPVSWLSKSVGCDFKHGKVTFADKACPVIFRFDRSRNAPTTSTRRF